MLPADANRWRSEVIFDSQAAGFIGKRIAHMASDPRYVDLELDTAHSKINYT
jgi:hypothetical protein